MRKSTLSARSDSKPAGETDTASSVSATVVGISLLS